MNNSVLLRPNKTTVTYAGENEEPQADTGNNFFQFLLEMVFLNLLRLF